MPIYVYTCQSCGHRFDTLRSIREADNSIPCPACNNERTKRQLTTFFAHSSGDSGGSSRSSGGGCGSCSGGSCGSCGH